MFIYGPCFYNEIKAMILTFEELKEKLKTVDEVTLLERLQIYSDEIVERFEDRIEEKYDELVEDYNEEEDE